MYPERMTVEAIDTEIARHEKRLQAFRKADADHSRPAVGGVVSESETALRDLAVKRAGAVKNGYHDAA